MRLSKYANNDPEVIREILHSAQVGYLGILLPDGYPRVIPINFASDDYKIFFHGALDGEKFEVLKAKPKVTFNTNLHYSYIPSYWRARKYAGKATMFYKSVEIKGAGQIVEDPEKKAEGLQLLMKKYQPEGKFQRITTSDRIYAKDLKETGVFVVKPEMVTCKVKMGQDYPEKVRRLLIEKLTERGEPLDLETARELQKSLYKG